MKSIMVVILVGFVASGCAYDPGFQRQAPAQERRHDNRDYRDENRQPAHEPVLRRDREYQQEGDQRKKKGDEGSDRIEQRRGGDHEQRREERD